MKNKTGQILMHVTGCIAFLSLPVLLSPDVSWDFRFIRLHPFQEEFITYTLLLLFFYLHHFLLMPDLFFRQKFFAYAGFVLLSYAGIAFLPHIVVPGNHTTRFQTADSRPPEAGQPGGGPVEPNRPPNGLQPPRPGKDGQQMPPPGNGLPEPREQRNDSGRFTGAQPPPNPGPPPGGWQGLGRGFGFFTRMPHFEYLFQFMMVLALSALIRVNNRLRQSEKERVTAELSYLKAQINPHFLFNTLNSIYSAAIDENADNTASAVVKLSGMMRYVISEAHHDYVALEKELDYISDYIELQKIRLGSTVEVLYKVTGHAAGEQIAPLILISFIENAFKHGVNPETASAIDIGIAIDAHTLQMRVQNNKVRTVHTDAVKTNVGLQNTRNRLQLLYPSKHELAIKDDEKEFLVLLKINLQ